MKIYTIILLALITSSCATTKYFDNPKDQQSNRTKDQIRNVWFSSYLDSDNNKHQASNVEIVIKRSDWIKK